MTNYLTAKNIFTASAIFNALGGVFLADYLHLKPHHMDVIREIGNIGAGNAATALSGILGRRVDMSVPEVKIIPLSYVPQILGEPEDPVVGGMVSMSGGLTGQILLVLGIREAYILASIMWRKGHGAHGKYRHIDSVGARSVRVIRGYDILAVPIFRPYPSSRA
jgi:chemotaxis protein CheY-P-specific phosphatase CheC